MDEGLFAVPTSTVTGDIGASPITGGAIHVSCTEVEGNIYTVDAEGPACRMPNASMLTTAISNMETAYTDAAGRADPDFVNLGSGELGSKTLSPGLYKWGTGVCQCEREILPFLCT